MSGQFNPQKTLSFDAGEDLSRYRRVKLSGDYEVSYADAGEDSIGVTRAAAESGDPVSVHLPHRFGSIVMVAAAAITQNDLVYPAADGKVTSTETGRAVGRALEAASGDGSEIEVLPILLDKFNDEANVISLHDDFFAFDEANSEAEFILINNDGGTVEVIDGVGGILSIATGTTDNDQAYVTTPVEAFKFADDKPLWFETRVALTEANTDDANVMVGLMDAVADDAIQDDGAGPKASYSGAVFYKVDGGTVWQAEVSDSTTQTAVTLSTDTFPGDGTYQVLAIEVIPTGTDTATVNFYIDGTLVGTATGFDYSNATELDVFAGVKAGGGNAETLLVDYITCKQVR